MTAVMRPAVVAPSASYGQGGMAFCSSVLPNVSRTFALCIRLLPPELERSVTVAYLMCRIADTIEDSADLTVSQKRTLLDHYRRCLTEVPPDTGLLQRAFARRPDDESQLVVRSAVVLGEFNRLTPEEREAIRPWVDEMCRGMAEFSRSSEGSTGGIATLDSMADLERYCYYVAGTVGHLLTGLYGIAFNASDRNRLPTLERFATSFGLGLQLTNIIKDAPEDHRRGWSFIPHDIVEREGIAPGELFGSEHLAESRRVFAALIDKAHGHLRDALEYCVNLPRKQYRIRLFCLTSLFFAIRTLARAATDERRLVEGGNVKISRAEVYQTLAVTLAVAPSNRLVRWYFERLRGDLALPPATS